MFDKILVVCVGNICRSPTGEALLKQLLPGKYISSAGLGVDKSGLSGHLADSMALSVAKKHGLLISEHKARQLTPSLCLESDLILVMEKQHLEWLTQLSPESRGKAMLFSQWLDQSDIADPYHKSEVFFDETFKALSLSAEAWAKKLSS
ncbi:low molecular weight protein-tyrosine-phosphatase [Marinomonas spartinae]|uniref:low molecular weight protein-tyrosine-phosphatase n=1 Tax=Marinomonas spartinae TaxID=1792290 RepID=UPI0018F1A70A|nr:low molecular weight protein-tyrosine-phosphatase [Marinomonas spartinae]MBJ7556439.1 low molecular weight phosphotyrosine protein phosphatase [Marinomonas spartinae]